MQRDTAGVNVHLMEKQSVEAYFRDNPHRVTILLVKSNIALRKLLKRRNKAAFKFNLNFTFLLQHS